MPGEACAPLPGLLDPVVRLSLLWTCLSLLLVKQECFEAPDRSRREFFLDASKQFVGAVWGWLISNPSNFCAAYWRSTVLETTLGVGIEYVLLTVLTRLFRKGTGNAKAFAVGEYEASLSPHAAAAASSNVKLARSYSMQLIIWLICVTVMKIVCRFLESCYPADSCIFLALFSWNFKVEVFAVMLLFPCAMYGMAVWVTDDFLKKEGTMGVASVMMSAVFSRPVVEGRTGNESFVGRARSTLRGSIFMGTYSQAFLKDWHEAEVKKKTPTPRVPKDDDDSSDEEDDGPSSAVLAELSKARQKEDILQRLEGPADGRRKDSDEDGEGSQEDVGQVVRKKTLETQRPPALEQQSTSDQFMQESNASFYTAAADMSPAPSSPQLQQQQSNTPINREQAESYRRDRQARARLMGNVEVQEEQGTSWQELLDEPPEGTRPALPHEEMRGVPSLGLEPISESILHGCSVGSQDFPVLSDEQLARYRAERERANV